ncbi:MAG TPA: hypothetical protein VF384_15705 [Planctomycetota bacterium]
MTAAAPSRERVLRALFWKLLFRGRSAFDAAATKRAKQWSLGGTLAVYTLFGLLPAIGAFMLPPLAFASSLHALTLMFASLSLASSAGTMLFVREESEILLHRPVRPEELLRAKTSVLVSYALLLALALNAAGLVMGLWNEGNAIWWPLAHALSTLLLMLFSASAIVLAYNVCLSWFGRERFDNLLTLVQTLMSVVLVVGSQLVPRMLRSDELRQVDVAASWTILLPPVWFGALDAVLCGALPLERAWLPAAIGVAVTFVLAWLAFVRLGAAYGRGLMALNETATAESDRPRRRPLSWLVRHAPLRWWLRDAVERQAFLLTTAYLVRDREIKLKLYPSLTPLVVMPVLIGIGPGGRRGGGEDSVFLETLALGYAAIVPIQAMHLLQHSEHWRAADLFRSAPLVHWTPLFHGARKAVLCWLALPAVVMIAGILVVLRGSASPMLMALPAVVAVLVSSYVSGLFGVWLPLSKASTAQNVASTGCIVFGFVIAGSMAFSGLAAWMHWLGWFWPFFAVAVAGGLALQAAFLRSMHERRWRPAVK